MEKDDWKLKFEQERKARLEAEHFLKQRSLELSNLNETLQNQKNELETIFETTIDGIAILDLKGNFLYFNNAYLDMSGYTKSELLASNCIELSQESERKSTKEAFEQTLKDGYLNNFEKTCIGKNGKESIFNLSIALMPDKQSFLITAKDITELKNKEKKLTDFVNLIDHNIITSTTDLNGNIIYSSYAFCKISGYEADELIGKNHRIIRHPDMPKKVFKDMWETISKDKTWEGEIKNLKKDGSYYWVSASISPIYDEKGVKIGYTAIRQDITDRKRVEEISITDGLTCIYNRRHFDDIFPKIVNSAKRNNGMVSFLIMDIDHFKQYNDTYGHQMGDEVLKEVAKQLKTSLKRAGDHCFRLGGEEFGVVFEVDTKEKALVFANTIRENIEKLCIEHKKNSVSSCVTISGGLVCEKANDIINEENLYKLADEFLYKAKETGRNKICTI